MTEHIVSRPDTLQLGPVRSRGLGWNGMMCLIASEAALFGFLLFAYFYLGAVNPRGWLLEPHPSLTLALPNTLLLLASSLAARWGERGIKRENEGQALVGLGLAFAMGLLFAIVQWFEWQAKSYGLATSSYGSLYFVTTGFHMAHILVGLVILLFLMVWVAGGYFSPLRILPASNGILYWHFVDAVWLALFTTYYLTPYLGFAR